MAIPRSQNDIILSGGHSGKTIGDAGCTFYAHCNMLIRAGIWNPEKDGNITKFVEYCRSQGMFDVAEANGMFDFVHISDYFSEAKVVQADVKNGNQDYSTITELKKFAKEAYSRGDYVIAYMQTKPGDKMSGHAIFIDKVSSDGSLSIMDSSSQGQVLGAKDSVFENIMSEYGGENSSIVYAMMEYQVQGSDSRETKPLWERFIKGIDTDDGSGRSGKQKTTKKEQQEIDQMHNEFEEIDWKPTELMLNQRNMDMNWYINGLSNQEKARVEALKESIEGDKFDFIEFFQQAIIFIGLILAIYGVFLILADLLDLVNPYLSLSMVSLLTFGKYHVRDKDMRKDNYDRKKYVTRFHYYCYCIFIIALGIMFATGTIQKFIFTLINWIGSLFG